MTPAYPSAQTPSRPARKRWTPRLAGVALALWATDLAAQATGDDEPGPLRRGPMVDLPAALEYWNEEPLIDPWLGIGSLAAIAAIVGALAAWRWWARRGERSRPGWLLDQARREAGLTSVEAGTLRRIADARGLPHALSLMVCPRTLDHHAQAYAQDHPAQAERTRATVATVRDRLFGPKAGTLAPRATET
ncbi:MAG: hypothetical protein AAF078_07855 [Planctomycetota bacterium]